MPFHRSFTAVINTVFVLKHIQHLKWDIQVLFPVLKDKIIYYYIGNCEKREDLKCFLESSQHWLKRKKMLVLTNATTYLETFGFESLPDEEKLFLVLKKQWKVKGEIRKPIISRKQPRQNKNRVKGNSEKFLTSFLLCLPNCKIYFI